MTALVLTCSGRAVDDRLQPVGDPCGAVYPRPMQFAVWMRSGARPRKPVTDDTSYVQSARAAGWSVAYDGDLWHVTCPQCRRPDTQTVAAVRDPSTPISQQGMFDAHP